jgi:hypothetical protein
LLLLVEREPALEADDVGVAAVVSVLIELIVTVTKVAR